MRPRHVAVVLGYAAFVVAGSSGTLGDVPDAVGEALFVIFGVAVGFVWRRWEALALAVLWPLVNVFVESDDAPAWALALAFSMPVAAVCIAVGVGLGKAHETRQS